MKRKNILLTFNGDRDPFDSVPVTNKKTDGPILTLLALKEFDSVVLFFTPDRHEMADATKAAIRERFPWMAVSFQSINLSDPTNYQQILSALRHCIASIFQPENVSDYYISLSSGTPHMHASWLLLTASGEIPAKLLHVRDPRRIEAGQSPYVEIDPRSSWFPHIAAVTPTPSVHPSLSVKDIKAAIQAAGIVGSEETIEDIIKTTAMGAYSDSSILIQGESGTGKELLAQLIHKLSPREQKKIVVVNCGGLHEQTLESALFGHEKGAFTGANSRRIGQFEEADGGTLFLDEVGELSPTIQVKLLRFLQEREFQRLGSNVNIHVDVRIISATNRDLEVQVKEGAFREDLFYRLKVITVKQKLLRERRQDIGILADHFVRKFNKKKKTEKRLTTEALQKLQQYQWPGNIRELCNVIERVCVTTYDNDICEQDIGNLQNCQNDLPPLPEFYEGFKLEEYCRNIRDALVAKAMSQSKNKKSEAARLLGVTPAALSKKK